MQQTPVNLGEGPAHRISAAYPSQRNALSENPVHTMELLLSDGAPSGADLSIQFHGKHYSVNTTGPLARWNRKAFQMLYLLFQMTVTDVPRVGIPSITIAK